MEQLSFAIKLPDPLDQLSADVMLTGSKRSPGSRRKKRNAIRASNQQTIQTTLAEPGDAQSLESMHQQKAQALGEPSRSQLSPYTVIGHRLRRRWIRRHQAMGLKAIQHRGCAAVIGELSRTFQTSLKRGSLTLQN